MRDIRPTPNMHPRDFPGDHKPPLSSLPKLPVPAGRSPEHARSTYQNQASNFNKKTLESKRLPPGAKVPVTNIQVAAPQKTASGNRLASAPSSAVKTKNPARSVRLGHRERKVVLALLGLVILASLLAGFIFLPRANVKMVLRTAPLLVDERLTIKAEGAEASGNIPGSAFFREVEITDSATVTSTEVIGTKTQGRVQLINRTVDEQKIKERSRLVTQDDKLFFMIKSATIPPAGTVSVEVEAAEAGAESNIEPQRLNFAALDAPAQSLVYAEATTALTGGSGENVAVIKEQDLETARQDAGSKARAKVEQEIRQELPQNWIILEESWTNEIISFTSEAALDSRQATIPYTARSIVRVIGYEQQALEAKLTIALTERLDQEYMLFPGPITYNKTVEDINWEQAEATVLVRVTHTTIPQLSLETLREKLAGRKRQEATTYLQGLPGVRSVDLNLWPFWVQSIPRIEKRIILNLQPERQP
ncbi:MAG: baseplate J/gp47 family protein [Candidatus Andersenbacteria bacterium]